MSLKINKLYLFQMAPARYALLCGGLVFFISLISTGFLGFNLIKHQQQNLYRLVMTELKFLATLIDKDQHSQLTSPDQTNNEQYRALIKPLENYHRIHSEIKKVYTVIFMEGKTFFVLDTTNNVETASISGVVARSIMDEYVLNFNDKETLWLPSLKKGEAYINLEPYTDEFGTFITASAPIMDDNNGLIGSLNIDISTKHIFIHQPGAKILLLMVFTFNLLISIFLGFIAFNNQKNVTLLQQKQKRLYNTDFLTGALNRRSCARKSTELWSLFERYKQGYAILIMDIDHFKSINDRYGHVLGDKTLIHFSNIVKEAVREPDTLYRIGGEEFAVLPNKVDKDACLHIAERIRKAVFDNPLQLDSGGISYTVSIGVTLSSDADKNIEDSYKRADQALYQAKDEGRNKVVYL
jgi:diguanylate cyclase (GGDEF)-like protein